MIGQRFTCCTHKASPLCECESAHAAGVGGGRNDHTRYTWTSWCLQESKYLLNKLCSLILLLFVKYFGLTIWLLRGKGGGRFGQYKTISPSLNNKAWYGEHLAQFFLFLLELTCVDLKMFLEVWGVFERFVTFYTHSRAIAQLSFSCWCSWHRF